MGEKRKYMRFNIIMDVLCRRKNGSNKTLKINNFSKEGVGILSEHSLTPGEEIEIEMNIPGDNIPVMFNGEIAWSSSPAQDSCTYRGGVRFKNIKNEDKSRLLEYIYSRWIVPTGSDKTE